MSDSKVPRRTFLTDKSFQFSLVSYTMAMSLAVIMSTYFGIYSFLRLSVQRAMSMGLGADQLFQQFLDQEQRMIFILFALNAIIIVAFMGFFGFFLSHRVAGPLSRLKQQLKMLANGEPVKPISFRRNDYFQELAEHVSTIADRVKK